MHRLLLQVNFAIEELSLWTGGNCLLVPVAATGSGTGDKTGEKYFSFSLSIRNWCKALLELFEFVVSGNLLEYFILLTASPVDNESSLFCFSVLAINQRNAQSKKWLHLHI